MLPTDVLAGEHRIIEQVLPCLEKIAAESVASGRLERQSAADAVAFFRLFADRCHHAKEEDLLFPAIEALGFPRDGGPTGVMVREHEAGRAHVRAMHAAIEAASAGDREAVDTFVEHAQGLVTLLRGHIQKEDHCLFPMVNQAIDKTRQRELIAAFERIDNEVGRQAYQSCRQIADRLADRYGVPRAIFQIAEPHGGCDCWLYGELAQQKRIVEKQNAAMTRDLEMARQIQRALIPRKPYHVRGLEVAFDYEPVIQVGGDLLDIVPVCGDRVLLFVGDVVGHGVKAALAMSAVKAALLSAVKSEPRPGSVLASVNRVVVDMFGDQVIPQFVTAACCLLEPEESRAGIALAGHPVPFWLRADAEVVVQEGEAGLPLGIDENSRYEETSLALEPGDVLVLYTDGIVEAFDPRDRLYGSQRLENVILQSAGQGPRELIDAVKRDLNAHRGGRALSDDVALLAVKFTGVSPAASPRTTAVSRAEGATATA